MSDPLAHDRERALYHVTEAQAALKQAALILRRTSGFYDDPLDPAHKRKRELSQDDGHEVMVLATAAAELVKRLQGTAHDLGR